MRTWAVDIESRISPKYAVSPTYFGFYWKVKVLSILCMAGFVKFRPEANWQ